MLYLQGLDALYSSLIFVFIVLPILVLGLPAILIYKFARNSKRDESQISPLSINEMKNKRK